ncbi:MAG: SMC-Scp complex subunit ScpB [Deltaproteobacteria bacterium]|nr:SMC-Scp complex subunit ScpB [Deltaproteobacteria bacterium]
MTSESLQAIVEALIFASDRALSLKKIVDLMGDVAESEIQSAIQAIQQRYQNSSHGIYLEEVAGGYHFRTKITHAAWLQKLFESKPLRMSRAQLETLAMVAYRQPITRIEIDAIRGVDSSHLLRTLLDRKLIRISGVKEVPGRPLLYSTTEDFLEFFNLKELKDLPSLEQLKELNQKALEKDSEPIANDLLA